MEAEVTITGNVGSDVDWRQVGPPGGRASFNVACTPSIRRGEEWVDAPTLWAQVTCWRRLAENVRDSVRKGDAVIVTGRLRVERWRNEDGNWRESLVVDATAVGHDLARGKAVFERTRVRPESTEPFESDAEAERRAAEESRDLAENEALERYASELDGDTEAEPDADGVIADLTAEHAEPEEAMA